MRVDDLLAQLVSFNTVSDRSTMPCMTFIRDYLASHGVQSELILDNTGEKACLWAAVGNAEASDVVLAGHVDVVPVEGQVWDSNPFELCDRDGKFFGRGTSDMKGFIACALALVPEVIRNNPETGFFLALTCDEELDMSGARRLVDVLCARDVHPSWVWVGEPTNDTIITQHKGCAALMTRIEGVSGHSSAPHKGLNAIDLGRMFMNAVQTVSERRRETPVDGSAFELPYTITNFGMFTGGDAENIIAGSCNLLWQIRAHPGDTAKAFLAEVDAVFYETARSLMTPFDVTGRVTIETVCDLPSFFSQPQNKGVAALQKALGERPLAAAGFATEAGLFQEITPDVVVFGPGSIAQAHQPNEFIDKKQLTSFVDSMRYVLLSSPALD